ncbi:MAG: hypothetical protein SWE60_24510 [Thermodesulfobacteriota bacterium]|nr:hypothetical protein [Thermodesulfobacteriota bacterium]
MVVFLLAYVCGFGPVAWGQQMEETETLEVIGRGRIYRDNVAKARNEAIADGLRNAVEQGVSLLIPSASVVERFQLLSDDIYPKADEVVHDYQVLTESQSGPYYRLVVRVTVYRNVLQAMLQDAGILTTDKGMPSVAFLLWEQNIGQALPRYSWDQSPFSDSPLTIEKTLSRYMQEKGFFVIDKTTAPTFGINLELESRGRELTDEAALRLARQLNAEVVIVGQGSARIGGNVSGMGMKSVEGVLSVRAIRADNGRAIGSSAKTRASVHADEMVAGTEALALAAADAAEDLSKQLVANWSKEVGQPLLVELTVGGIEAYGDFVTFRTILRDEIRSVKDVHLKAIRAGEAKMDVDIKGNSRMLADELMVKRFQGFGVNISEVDEGRIRLEIIRKQDVWKGWKEPEDDWETYRSDDLKTYAPSY